MAFWNRIFGGEKSEHGPKVHERVEHEGYSIETTPIAEAGQYRLAAIVSRSVDDETLTYRMIRADLFASAEDASHAAIRKAKQVIAEQGDRIFEDSAR